MSTPFSSSEVSTIRSYFLNNININGQGGIVAAPDYDTPGGSYYYHWMRDAALSMRCLQDTNTGSFSDIEGIVKSYAQWVLKVQNEGDPNGQDVRTEPKFMLPNGEVFSGAWCRPQNDGPGLRATALILAANSLIAAGEKDYVKQYLWTGDGSKYHGGAIKYDLDWVVNGYNSNTCDLWEEIRDPDFFWNRITMKKAMIVGAEFAQAMGDYTSANAYTAAMQQINSTLYSSHYNGAFVQECNARTRDSAVIVGFNDGFDDADNMFAPSGIEVANTVASYNAMFCKE
jgi:glucoamylase